ncbi:MAG: signal peptidase I [Gemmatimonadota bacterium]|nr:MAG: signal peptidase I [Gemmatimonadota bacterium]
MKGSRTAVWIRVGFWLVVAVSIFGALWATRFGERVPSIYIMTGQSMEPTLAEGEYFVAWSPPDRIERGDLVIFRFARRAGDFHVLRRLAALPGDTVAMDSGVVILNGKTQPWPFDIASPGAWRSELAIEENIYTWGPWVVPPDSAVLLSDRRDMFGWPDSRFLGFIPLDDILARADFTLRGRQLH